MNDMNLPDQPTPETDAAWSDKSRSILEHARNLERDRDAARLRERETVNLLLGALLDENPDSREPLKLDPPCDLRYWNDTWPDEPIRATGLQNWVKLFSARIDRLSEQRDSLLSGKRKSDQQQARAHPVFYVASKFWHAAFWKRMKLEYPEYRIQARWINAPEPPAPLPDQLAEWCLDDVTHCDALVLFEPYEVPDADQWTGALIEVGAALALGKQVLAVVSPVTESRLSVWAKHENFQFVDTLEAAFGWRAASQGGEP